MGVENNNLYDEDLNVQNTIINNNKKKNEDNYNNNYNNKINNNQIEIKKKRLELKKSKIFAIISILVFIINIFIFGGIYLSLHISKNDLDDLNQNLDKLNSLNGNLILENKTLNNLSLTELEYSNLLSNIEDELNELNLNKNQSNVKVINLKNDIFAMETQNIQLENNIKILEAKLK